MYICIYVHIYIYIYTCRKVSIEGPLRWRKLKIRGSALPGGVLSDVSNKRVKTSSSISAIIDRGGMPPFTPVAY